MSELLTAELFLLFETGNSLGYHGVVKVMQIDV